MAETDNNSLNISLTVDGEDNWVRAWEAIESPLSSVNEAVDGLIVTLNNLDTALGGFKGGNIAAGLTPFLDSMVDLRRVAEDSKGGKVRSFVAEISDTIEQLSAVQIKAQAVAGGSLLSAVETITKIFRELKGLGEDAPTRTSTDRIARTATAINSLFTVLAEIRPESTANIDQLDQSISIIQRVLAKFQPVNELISNIKSPDNLASATTAVKDFVDFIGVVHTMFTGDLEGLQGFDSTSQVLAKAIAAVAGSLEAVNKIKRPANLAVIGAALEGLMDFIQRLAAGDAQFEGIADRVIKIRRLRSLIRALAEVFSEFDIIKRPQNLVALQAGIEGLVRIMKELQAGTFQFDTIVERWKNIGALRRVVKNIAKTLAEFDRIKSPGNIGTISTAINAVASIIRALSNLDAPLAATTAFGRIGERLGIVSTAATRLASFIRTISRAVKSFGKLPQGAEANINATASLLRAFASLFQLLQDDLQVVVSNDDTVTQFGESASTSIRAITQVLEELQSASKIVSKIKPSTLESFKIAIEAIEILVRIKSSLAKAGSFEGSEDQATGLRNFVRGIRDALGDLSSINVPAGLADVLNSVTSFSDGITSVGPSLTSSSGGISSALKSLGQGVAGVAGIGVKIGKSLAEGIGSGIKAGLRVITFPANVFNGLVSAARETAKKISDIFGKLGNSARDFGRELSDFGKNLLVTGGIGGFIQSQAVQAVAGFESIIKQVEVLGGVTGKELAAAEEFILRLGETSVFNATESAAAFLDLTKAGLSTAEVYTSLPDIMNLAAGGLVSVADASGLVIAAVGAFDDLGFGDAAAITDSFVAAANVGTAEVSDLQAAFGSAGPAANAFAQSLDVTNASLSVLISGGLEGSRAGTGLRALFSAMTSPTAGAAKALDGLASRIDSVSSGTDFLIRDGEFRELPDIITDLNEALVGLPPAEQAQILKEIAGSANAATVLQVLTKETEAGVLVLDDYIEKMDESASAADTAAALMDTFQGSLEELGGAFETLLLKSLLPVIEFGLRPLVDVATKVVRIVSSLPEPVLAVGAALSALIPLLLTVVGAFALMSGLAIQFLGFTLLPALQFAFLALANPIQTIALLVGGQGIFLALITGAALALPLIVAVGAAFKKLAEAFQTEVIQDKVKQVIGALEALLITVRTVAGQIGTFFATLFGFSLPTGDDIPIVGVVYTILAVIENFVTNATAAVAPIGELFETLTGFFFGLQDVAIDPVDVSDIIVGELPKLSADQFQEMFDIEVPVELADIFDFDIAKDLLVLESYDYSNDISQLRELEGEYQNLEGDVSAFTRQYENQIRTVNEAGGTVTRVSDELLTLDEIMDNLDPSGAAFQELAGNLEQFTSNPIVRAIFGQDVTGDDLAQAFSAAVITVSQLKAEAEKLILTFTKFFVLFQTEGIGPALDQLGDDLAASTARIGAIVLDVVANIFGLEGLDDTIATLASGNLTKGALLIGEQIGIFMVTGFINKIGLLASVGARVIDAILGTSIAPQIDRIFGAAEKIARTLFRIVRDIVTLFNQGKKSSGFIGFINAVNSAFETLAGGAEFLAAVLEPVWILFTSGIQSVEDVGGAFTDLINIFFEFDALQAVFGDVNSFIGWITDLKDAFGSLGSAIGDTFSDIFEVLSGDKSLTEFFLNDLPNNIIAVLKAGIELAFTALGPFISLAWSKIVTFIGSIDWATQWETVKTAASTVITAASIGVSLAWDKIVTIAGSIDWQAAWDTVKGGLAPIVTDAETKILLAWDDIISFTSTLTTLTSQDVIDVVQPALDTAITDAGAFGIEVASLFVELDKEQALIDVGTFAEDVSEAIADVVGPLVTLNIGVADVIIDNLVEAGESLEDVDWESLGLGIGIFTAALVVLGGVSIAPILAVLVPLSLILIALPALINGVVNAIPDLVKGFEDLGEGDIDGALGNFGNAIISFAEGIGEVAIEIAEFINELFGFGVDIEASLAMWGGIIDAFSREWGKAWRDIRIDALENILNLGSVVDEVFGTDFTSGLKDTLDSLRIEKDIADFVASGVDAASGQDITTSLWTLLQFDTDDVPADLQQRAADGILEVLNSAAETARADADAGLPLVQGIYDLLLEQLVETGELDPALFSQIETSFGPEAATLLFNALDAGFANAIAGVDGEPIDFTSILGSLLTVDDTGIEVDTAPITDNVVSGLESDLATFQEDILTTTAAAGSDAAATIAANLTLDGAEAAVTGDTIYDVEGVTSTGQELMSVVETDTANMSLAFDTMAESTKESLDEVGADIVELQDAVTLLNTVSTTDFVAIEAQVTTSVGIIFTQLQIADTSVITLTKSLNKLQLTFNTVTTFMKTQIGQVSITFTTEIDKMSDSVRTLVERLAQAVELLGKLGGVEGNVGEAAANVPQRQHGGSVFPGRLYEVAEKGLSELLRFGDQTFLIPGQRGDVIPAESGMGAVGGSLQPEMARPSTTNNNVGGNVAITQGSITVQVSGGATEDAIDQIQDQIAAQQEAHAQRTMADLRGAGRI